MSALCRAAAGVHGKMDKEGLKRAADLLEQQTSDGDAILERAFNGDDVANAILPLLLARRQIEPRRAEIEKQLASMAKDLPIAHIVEETKGLGYLSLAGIVGEAGAIGEYRTVSGLWKRLGLAVIDGERQRRKTDVDEALRHGYSPARRSLMWNVGGSLIGGMGRGPRPLVGEAIDQREDWSEWQKMFVRQLRREVEKNPEQKRPDAERNGSMFESFGKHASNRAKRYVEKQFLKKLWQTWRATQSPARSRPDTQRDSGRALVEELRPIEKPTPTGMAAGVLS